MNIEDGFEKKQRSPKKNKTRTKNSIIIGLILAMIIGGNLIIYINYKINIETNYYSLAQSPQDPFYHKPIVVIALEKRIEPDPSDINFFRLGIFNESDYEITFARLTEWKWDNENNKYLYICNFTENIQHPDFYGELKENTTYRFFLHLRSWYSPEFGFNKEGYFYWISE